MCVRHGKSHLDSRLANMRSSICISTRAMRHFHFRLKAAVFLRITEERLWRIQISVMRYLQPRERQLDLLNCWHWGKSHCQNPSKYIKDTPSWATVTLFSPRKASFLSIFSTLELWICHAINRLFVLKLLNISNGFPSGWACSLSPPYSSFVPLRQLSSLS